ncbi:Unknown protein, partial [Striga hermonthica]
GTSRRIPLAHCFDLAGIHLNASRCHNIGQGTPHDLTSTCTSRTLYTTSRGEESPAQSSDAPCADRYLGNRPE